MLEFALHADLRHYPRPMGNPASVRIRPATPADGDRVAAMCAGLSAAEGLGIASRFSPEAFRRDGFGPDPAFSCLIAEAHGEAIGYALHCRDYDTDRLCRSVYLVDLYVETAARGKGVGRALMAAVARAGRAEGAELMMWGVLKSNQTARRFYATIGEEVDDQIETAAVGQRFRSLVAGAQASDGLSLRAAQPDDTPLLARFLDALLVDIGLPRRPGAAERFSADGFGGDPAFTAIIAERAGTPLGYSIFWPTYDTESACRGGWLSDLYVAPEARGHGVARQLLSEVARGTAARGGRYLVWLVHASNHNARAFYRRYSDEWHDGLACICADDAFNALADSARETMRD
jgi:ribosomal protein S18 acetylase RimI-like enzyme